MTLHSLNSDLNKARDDSRIDNVPDNFVSFVHVSMENLKEKKGSNFKLLQHIAQRRHLIEIEILFITVADPDLELRGGGERFSRLFFPPALQP